jgi:hypothetical protein
VFDVPVYFRWNERFIRYVSSVQEIIRLGWWNLPLLRYDSCSTMSEEFEIRRMFKICYRRRTHYSYADFYFVLEDSTKDEVQRARREVCVMRIKGDARRSKGVRPLE